MDKWLYFLKHLDDMENLPKIFDDEVFQEVYENALIAKMTVEQYDQYQYSLKVFRDNINVIETARKEGLEKGMIEGKKEGMKEGMKEGERNKAIGTAKTMLQFEEPIEKIIKYTNLTKEEIEKLKNDTF